MTTSPPLPLLAAAEPNPAQGDALDASRDEKAHKGWRTRAGDLCFITLRVSTFLGSSYLMALGVPLVFFLAISGGDAPSLFAHLANLAERFLAADHARQVSFLAEFKLVLIAAATLIAAWRLPRFLRDLERDLLGGKK
ncbi:hypothetical protein ABIE62_001091 [Porphyrobacter sp. MBR-155]|jgi:hypothetical protein|uniref:hypothetical protein n=1 Tax=Porphyrobacter sp. MBR-155 TaxID=3156464 RepID=UPI00339182DF